MHDSSPAPTDTEQSRPVRAPALTPKPDASHPAPGSAHVDECQPVYQRIFDNMAVGVIVDSGGTILRCNVKLAAMYGFDARDLPGLPITLLMPGGQTHFDRVSLVTQDGQLCYGVTGELEAVRLDGTRFWIRATSHILSTIDGTKTFWIIEDISHARAAAAAGTGEGQKPRARSKTRELERDNARLRQEVLQRTAAEQRSWHAAHHDALTGLANRVLLSNRLNRELELARRHHAGMALLYIDMDGFKAINDTHGHEIGDRFLTEVASRLEQSVRSGDMVARVGGDEFVILLQELQFRDDAILVARKVLEMLSQPLTIDGIALTAMASVGISLFPEHGGDSKTLMRHADLAMYHAKSTGHNMIQVFDARMKKDD